MRVVDNTVARQQVKRKGVDEALAPEGEEGGPRMRRAPSRAPSATRTCKMNPPSPLWTIKLDSRYEEVAARAFPIVAEGTSGEVLAVQLSVVAEVRLEPEVDLQVIEDAVGPPFGEAGETGRGYVVVTHF